MLLMWVPFGGGQSYKLKCKKCKTTLTAELVDLLEGDIHYSKTEKKFYSAKVNQFYDSKLQLFYGRTIKKPKDAVCFRINSKHKTNKFSARCPTCGTTMQITKESCQCAMGHYR